MSVRLDWVSDGENRCFRREKEEGGKKDDEEEENEDVLKRGFVPIGQAVKNAEVRDAAAAHAEQ